MVSLKEEKLDGLNSLQHGRHYIYQYMYISEHFFYFHLFHWVCITKLLQSNSPLAVWSLFPSKPKNVYLFQLDFFFNMLKMTFPPPLVGVLLVPCAVALFISFHSWKCFIWEKTTVASPLPFFSGSFWAVILVMMHVLLSSCCWQLFSYSL